MNWVVPASAGTQQTFQPPQSAPSGWQRLVVLNHSPNAVYVSAGYRTNEAAADHVIPPRSGLAVPLDGAGAVTVLVDPAGAADVSAGSRVEVLADDCPSEQASAWQLPDTLDYHDSHSGQYGTAASDVAIDLDTLSGEVEIWNRSSTAVVYVNFGNVKTSAGGTDLQLQAGEFWHGSVATRAVHYQGGAMQLAVFA